MNVKNENILILSHRFFTGTLIVISLLLLAISFLFH